jgi:hypothetical protein
VEHQHTNKRTGTAGASVKTSREENREKTATTTYIRSMHAEKIRRRPKWDEIK